MHFAGVRGQPFALALTQAARDIHNRVTLHQRPQGVQHLQRQRAGTRAKLPDFSRTRGLKCLGHLAGQGLAKTRGQLGRGDKIAAAALHASGHQAEFEGVVGVVAQARCVERQRHEVVKAYPAARSANGLDDAGMQVAR